MDDARGPSKFVTVQQDKSILVLDGAWTVQNASDIARAIEIARHEVGPNAFAVTGEDIEKLDTTGALLLKKLLPEHQQARLTDDHRAVLDFLPPVSDYKPQPKPDRVTLTSFCRRVGEATFIGLDFLWSLFVFIGRVSVRIFRNFSQPRRFRLPSIVRHVQETGLNALTIIGLLAVLISMVITYQGAVQLKRFGADIYTVDLTVIALLREMGVLVTAIMVAGRSGSAFAAEIGVMKLRDEVSALTTMGMDPIEVLVVPRIIALAITLPLLTFLADIIGLAGGAVMSTSLLDISIRQYINRVQDVAEPTTFFVGIIKAPVFAFLIAVIGCFQGLNVSGSAESVGRRTTLSVVQAIFLVIMADALFSVVFSEVGI
jgi:phospholipid/cholesterol/gamma-HCH transport system permease protein